MTGESFYSGDYYGNHKEISFNICTSFVCSCGCGCLEPEPVYYTVTFNSDGGSEIESLRVLSGARSAEPENPTKTVYVFAHWYNGNSLYDFSTPVTADITL